MVLLSSGDQCTLKEARWFGFNPTNGHTSSAPRRNVPPKEARIKGWANGCQSPLGTDAPKGGFLRVWHIISLINMK